MEKEKVFAFCMIIILGFMLLAVIDIMLQGIFHDGIRERVLGFEGNRYYYYPDNFGIGWILTLSANILLIAIIATAIFGFIKFLFYKGGKK